MTLLLFHKDPYSYMEHPLGCKAENHVSIAKMMCTEIYSYFISPIKDSKMT